MKPFLIIHTCLGLEIIDVNTIVRIEASSNYSKLFFANNKTLVVAKTLQFLQCKLLLYQFTRVHKTHLVNLHFITRYKNGNQAFLFFTNGEKINISLRRKKDFLQYYYDVNDMRRLTTIPLLK